MVNFNKMKNSMLIGLFLVAHAPVAAAFGVNYMNRSNQWPVLLCGFVLISLNALVVWHKIKGGGCHEK